MAKSRAAHAPQSCPAGVPLIVRGWQLCSQPVHLCCQPQTHIDIRHTNTEPHLLSPATGWQPVLPTCATVLHKYRNKHKIRAPLLSGAGSQCWTYLVQGSPFWQEPPVWASRWAVYKWAWCFLCPGYHMKLVPNCLHLRLTLTGAPSR